MDLKKILPVFSYIFHPIFVSLYGTLFFFLITNSFFYNSQIIVTLIQVTILTLLLPLSMYFLFRSLGVVSSFTEASISERKMPIAVQAILLFVLIKFSVSRRYSCRIVFLFPWRIFKQCDRISERYFKIQSQFTHDRNKRFNLLYFWFEHVLPNAFCKSCSIFYCLCWTSSFFSFIYESAYLSRTYSRNDYWSWTSVVFISILVIKYKTSNQFSM